MNELCFIFSLDSNPVLVLISWIWTLLRGKFSFRYHNSMHFSFPSLLMNTTLNHIEYRAHKVTNCWLESSKFRFFRVIKLKKFEFSIHPHLHFPHEGIRFRIFTVFSWFDNVSVFQHFNKAEVIDFTLIVIVRLCYWQLQFLTLIFCSLIASLLPFFFFASSVFLPNCYCLCRSSSPALSGKYSEICSVYSTIAPLRRGIKIMRMPRVVRLDSMTCGGRKINRAALSQINSRCCWEFKNRKSRGYFFFRFLTHCRVRAPHEIISMKISSSSRSHSFTPIVFENVKYTPVHCEEMIASVKWKKKKKSVERVRFSRSNQK